MELYTEYHDGKAVIKDKSKHAEAMERLAVYERAGLPENLDIVKLMNIGEEVYVVNSIEKLVDKYYIESILKSINGFRFIASNPCETIFKACFTENDFGKSIFRTKEEALRALHDFCKQ